MALRDPSLLLCADNDSTTQVLWKDGDRVLCRRSCAASDGNPGTILMIFASRGATSASGA
jgi:hypothetical protein